MVGLNLDRRGRGRIALGAILAVCAIPECVSAHLVTSGVGPFYDGVAHFFVSPDDLVVALALALFGGLSGRQAARRLVVVLPLCWLAGAALGAHGVAAPGSGWVPALSMILAGGLAALNPKVPVFVPAAVAGALGFMHGGFNGQAMAASNTPFLAAWGIAAAAGILVLLLAAWTTSFHKGWQQIAARALGSWAAAIGLLALAWKFRPDA